MEFLADPNQSVAASTVELRSATENRTERRTCSRSQQTLCKSKCCGCMTPTSLRCMGICFTGTLLLIVGTVMIALYFSSSQTKTYLIPALVLFILGIIFITIAEWFCRVKVYRRYGQNHQRTLERLSGIERRLNSRPGSMPDLTDEPPPYNSSHAQQQRNSEVVIPPVSCVLPVLEDINRSTPPYHGSPSGRQRRSQVTVPTVSSSVAAMEDGSNSAPPYHDNEGAQQSTPEVVVPRVSSVTIVNESAVNTASLSFDDISHDDAPSYNVSVSDDVLPSYNEATSSDFGVTAKDQEDGDFITDENV